MKNESFVSLVAAMVNEFIGQHDGFKFSTSVEHQKPSRYSEGHNLFSITITCPTGEPALKEEVNA